MLVSSLTSGALWLLPLVPWDEPSQSGGWFLFLIGATYVVIASTVLAARRGVVVWVVAWLVPVVIWTWIVSQIGGAGAMPSWPESFVVGGTVATFCFLAWQALRLAIWLPLSWASSGRST